MIGTRPYDFIVRDYGKPVVVTAFEPIDILHATVMLVRQLREGRCEVENQYTRVVRRDGNPRALAALEETMELRDTFEWRGLGWIERSALKLRAEFAEWDAEARFELPGTRIDDPKACQCGEVLIGAIKPWECKVFGTACTPERPIGTCMVSSEGACAAYYNYGRLASAARSRARVRRRRPKLRDELVTLAHGSGGKATRALVEGALRRGARATRCLRRSATRRCSTSTARGSPSRPTRTSSSRSSSPAVTSASWPSTARSTTSRSSGARPIALSAGFVIEEGFAVADLRRIAASMARAAGAAGVPVATGDTKVVERGKADGLYVTTAGVGLVAAGVELGPEQRAAGRPRARLGHARRSRHGRHDRPRRARARGRPRERHRAGARARSRSLLDLGGAVRWMRDPTRGGLATALNELAQQAGVAVALDESALPLRPAVVGTCEILGIDPLYVASEGRLVAVVAAEAWRGALAALRSHPLGAEAAIVGEVARRARRPRAHGHELRR